MGPSVQRLVASLALVLVLGAAPLAAAPTVVCIDPGHGGTDPGAVGCGLEEAEVNLEVALRLQALLADDPDLEPILTRTTNTSVSLDARTSYANDHGAGRFASIHCNAADGTASGIETFAYTYGSNTSFNQRDQIQDAMTSTWPNLPDRGGKTANFYVIKYTSMPATLSELAFIDHCSTDAKLLASTTERQRAAEAHHAALRASLGLPADGGPVTPPVTDQKGVLRGVVFEDLGVGAADMSIRVTGANVTASGQAGYGTTVTDAPTASWALSLPAGTYTVTASKAGYVTGSRDCTVTAGGEEWCSLGLLPTGTVTPPAAKGRLVGVVYENAADGSADMSHRLPGAWVAAAGPGASSASAQAGGTDASWSLEVGVGTWAVTASAANHVTATRVCVVEPNADTWCSVGLDPVQVAPPTGPTGTLKGVAYLLGPNGPDDMSQRLPGALVRAKGPDGAVRERVAPFPDAMWSIEAPVGTHVVTGVLDGYTSAPQTCVVSKGEIAWCSVGLKLGQSLDPGTVPGGANGTLSGFVYQLDPSGSGDQGVRLPGAIVTLTGAQGVAGALVAGEGQAAFTKSVPPGQYFVVAALTGYLSTGRSCLVLSDHDTFCPLGLALEGSGPVTPPDYDVAGPDLAGPDAAPGPDTAGPDAADTAGADTGDDHGFGYTVETDGTTPVVADRGCALSPASRGATGAAWLAGLGLLLLSAARRRARRALLALALVTALPLSARAEPTTAGPRLLNTHAVTPAQGFTQPVWSPDGARVAVAGPGYASLWVLDVAVGALNRVAEGPQCGLNPAWSPVGDRLGVRSPGQRGGDVPLLSRTPRGEPAEPVANPTPGRWLLFRDDQAWLRVGTAEARLSPDGERACCGSLSPDGRWATFVGLTRGVFVHDTATGRTHALGPGAHPRFDAAGRHLTFQTCADDGQRLTACTLHLVDLGQGAPRVHAIVDTPPLATHPALSPDGRTLAFEVEGAVWIGTVEPQP